MENVADEADSDDGSTPRTTTPTPPVAHLGATHVATHEFTVALANAYQRLAYEQGREEEAYMDLLEEFRKPGMCGKLKRWL